MSDLRQVTNCWTIYTAPAEVDFAQIGRPQDWGDPRWMYRVYVLEAQGYRNTVHCWHDGQIEEHKHLEKFAGCICLITLPGWPPQKSGRDLLAQDDFWDESWGVMPPHWDEDEDEDES